MPTFGSIAPGSGPENQLLASYTDPNAAQAPPPAPPVDPMLVRIIQQLQYRLQPPVKPPPMTTNAIVGGIRG